MDKPKSNIRWWNDIHWVKPKQCWRKIEYAIYQKNHLDRLSPTYRNGDKLQLNRCASEIIVAPKIRSNVKTRWMEYDHAQQSASLQQRYFYSFMIYDCFQTYNCSLTRYNLENGCEYRPPHKTLLKWMLSKWIDFNAENLKIPVQSDNNLLSHHSKSKTRFLQEQCSF